ncbi:transcriptional regulatory protein C1F7.11c 2 [Stagonosporopsis vannaccii]|nr:transcriptional regulatory protein C1F7.11c 2 [Stagonosporopsis vannaccii]
MITSIRREADGGDTGDARPEKRQRKQRPCYSCGECRRLKMKCNRQVPCSNCVRRGRVAFCKRTASDVHTSDTRGKEGQIGTTANSSSANRQSMDENPAVHISSAQFPVNNHAQGHDSNGPVPLTIHTNGMEPSNNALHSEHGWIMQNSGTHIADETLGPTNHHSSGPSNADAIVDVTDDATQDGSYGTLMLSEGGRSKYLGPTAGSEWLRDSENQNASGSPTVLSTRAPSPVLTYDPLPAQRHHSATERLAGAFPFSPMSHRVSTRDLVSRLPPKEEALALVSCYYRYCAWHHDVAPRDRFEKIFDRVYALINDTSRRVNTQELALVFIILAQGNVFNIEIASDPTVPEELLRLSELALMKGDFLSNNTVAGVQTLHLMAHLHLNWDQGSRGDRAWPVWGLVMRLIQAMGMHRDGARWNLPQDVVEERRKVFWECNAADVFQAHCFSRPSAVNPEHCDTAFPSEPQGANGEKGYFTLRFELSQISAEILNTAMKVQRPSYSTILELDAKLSSFERNIPFALRSRTAYLSMPSQYSTMEDVLKASPEPSRTSVTVTFQRMNLAFNISETFINLHRPYYAKVLYNPNDESIRSLCAPSFLTTIERCAIIIALVSDVQANFTNVSTRQWNLWYHVFGSALCLGTMVLSDPSNTMSSFALAQIDAAITLFASLIENGGGTPRYRANLEWLKKLRARAIASLQAAAAGPSPDDPHANGSQGGVGEDEELVGWRTRLIERAGQSQYKSRTIRLSESPGSTRLLADVSGRQSDPHGNVVSNQGTAASLAGSALSAPTHDLSTNDLLTGFWEPMLLQDAFDASNNQSEFLRSLNPTWWEDT